MTDYNHPITPARELVRQWCYEDSLGVSTSPRWFEIVCTKAARWGADQELEACCADVQTGLGPNEAVWLRSVRRPWPPSLKKQALDELQLSFGRGCLKKEGADTIRRALESLPD